MWKGFTTENRTILAFWYYVCIKIVLKFTTYYVIITARGEKKMASFGENLRALRKSRGYSQEKFARVINSNQANVTAWERGMRMPTLNTIKGIADVFNIPVSMLLPLGEVGTEEDADRELLDYINSNKLIRDIIDKSRYLSEADLRMILDVIEALTRAKV